MDLWTRYKKLSFWNKVGAAGAAASIIGIPLALTLYQFQPNAPNADFESPKVHQKTTGYQSPAINANGNVHIIYGVNENIVERWEQHLRKQDLSDHEVQARLKDLASDYSKFKDTLSKRPPKDTEYKDVLRWLENGQWEAAEDKLADALETAIRYDQVERASDIRKDLSSLKRLLQQPLFDQQIATTTTEPVEISLAQSPESADGASPSVRSQSSRDSRTGYLLDSLFSRSIRFRENCF